MPCAYIPDWLITAEVSPRAYRVYACLDLLGHLRDSRRAALADWLGCSVNVKLEKRLLDALTVEPRDAWKAEVALARVRELLEASERTVVIVVWDWTERAE